MAVAALPSPYFGAPVIPLAPNRAGDRAHEWDWGAVTTSALSGLTTVTSSATYGSETITLSYDGLSRAEARTLEAFVDTRAGRKDGFWCPSFQQDFRPVSANGDVRVREYGYATEVWPLGWWAQQFAFYRPPVGWFLTSVYAIAAFMGTDGDGTLVRQYNVQSLFGAGDAGVTSAVSGLVMMRLLYVRFAEDAITTAWTHPNFASITLRVVAIPLETPQPV